jgi:hypothetical protein
MKSTRDGLLVYLALYTAPISVPILLVRAIVQYRREHRNDADRVIKQFSRPIVRDGVEISFSLIADGRTRLIEVAANANGAPGTIERLPEPVYAAEIERAIERIARVARRDETLAAALTSLPDATPLEQSELSPGVELAPDGLRIGLLGGRLVAVLDGVHQFLPRNVRLAAAIEKLRAFARGGSETPYR